MSDAIGIATFWVWCALWRRTVRPHSHATTLVTVLGGALVLDASELPRERSGTLALFHVRVLGGRLSVVLPPDVDAVVDVRASLRASVTSQVGAGRDRSHVLVTGMVAAGDIRIECRR